MEKKKTLTEIEEQSRRRIIQLINEYCDGSQHNFAQKTNLNKGSVSQYVNGKNTPSDINAQKIADTFNVSVMWVKGFDVDKQGEFIEKIKNTSPLAKYVYENDPNSIAAETIAEFEIGRKTNEIPELKELISYYEDMTEDNRIKVINFTLDVKSGKEPLVCHDITEKNIIMAYRNASQDIKIAVCAVLGIKRDSESEMDDVINK